MAKTLPGMKGVTVPDTGFFYHDGTHRYFYDGKLMTGVTTVLNVLAKPALIQWSANMAAAYALSHADEMDTNAFASVMATIARLTNREAIELDKSFPTFKAARNAHTAKKEAAGTHGTDTHKLIETYVKKCLAENEGKPVTDFEAPEIIQPFISWSLENVDHFLFSERLMHDPKQFFAGTADFGYVGKDGRRYIGDFKTSSGIYGIDYWLQVSAYRYLAEVEGDAPYDGMTVVRIGKDDGQFEAHSLYEYETYRDVFLSCLRIYRAQQGHAGMTVKAY
jgi:hypothetical protein